MAYAEVDPVERLTVGLNDLQPHRRTCQNHVHVRDLPFPDHECRRKTDQVVAEDPEDAKGIPSFGKGNDSACALRGEEHPMERW